MAHSASPALYTDDCVALLEHAQTDGVLDAPLETGVNVFLPGGLGEIGLLLCVVEGIDATVEVGVAGGTGVSGDHDDL